MHRSLRSISAASLFACAPALLCAQGKFEGTMTIRLMGGQGPQDLTYSVRGTRYRMDIEGNNGRSMYILRDANSDVTDMVLPSQHMYMEMNMAGMGANTAGRGPAPKAPDIKMTGHTENIAGYECEHATITGDNNEQYDVCAAKGLGTFMAPANPMARGRGADPAWQRMRDFFPLKVQKVGESDPVMLVTKIDKKPLDESLFTLPSDFQKMDMSGMMGGRMGRPPR